MTLAFGCLLFLAITTMKVNITGFDEKYLSKDTTLSIKGLFVMLVFLSHIKNYVDFSNILLDQYVIKFLYALGQLMVTMFLFYSGYGIYESIKKKGFAYVQKMPVNRILKTFINFAFAILLFWLCGLLMDKNYSLQRVLLSLSGWTSIGNSNWYMFAIFTLYIITYICFRVIRDRPSLSIFMITLCSLMYVYVMSKCQPDRFSNTYLCYAAGLWYSYFKEKIDLLIRKRPLFYYITFIVLIFAFLMLAPYRNQRLMIYNLVSLLFCMIIVLASMKISIHSHIIKWFGKYLFWIYILQRIPMNIMSYYGIFVSHPYVFMIMVFLITLMLSYCMDFILNKIRSREKVRRYA